MSIVKKTKTFFPYILIIFIYFFFINIEARKEIKMNNRNSNIRENKRKKQLRYSQNSINSNIKDESIRISIPVIPYKN